MINHSCSCTKEKESARHHVAGGGARVAHRALVLNITPSLKMQLMRRSMTSSTCIFTTSVWLHVPGAAQQCPTMLVGFDRKRIPLESGSTSWEHSFGIRSTFDEFFRLRAPFTDEVVQQPSPRIGRALVFAGICQYLPGFSKQRAKPSTYQFLQSNAIRHWTAHPSPCRSSLYTAACGAPNLRQVGESTWKSRIR